MLPRYLTYLVGFTLVTVKLGTRPVSTVVYPGIIWLSEILPSIIR